MTNETPASPEIRTTLVATRRLTCAIAELDTTDLLRKEVGDVSDIVESMRENIEKGLPALIHPVVVDSKMRLISGSRRLAAHKIIGLTTIDYQCIGTLSEDDAVRLEVEANYQKLFTWQERILGIAKHHRFYVTRAALEGKHWGLRESADLLRMKGTSKTALGRMLYLAPYLNANDQEIWKSESVEDAYRVLIKRAEDERAKLLVAQSRTDLPTGPAQTKPTIPRLDVTDEDFFGATTPGTTGFAIGVGVPVDLDERPGEASVDGQQSQATNVPLSRMFFHGDAVAVCKTFAEGTFDAVITDWPYGIDLGNLNQGNDGHAYKDIEGVLAEHTVSGNEDLHAAIIPEIYRILKPNGWFITWTDQMQWQRNYDLAIAAGFKVMRWPLTWHKTSSCMNQLANVNFTKNTEIAIVCRKGNATLIRPQASSVWQGGNDAETRLLGHPFAKPAGLWEWVYNATCQRGALVLDPFVGSGSSVLPAVRLGLRPMGIESNETHFGTLNVNLQNFYKSLDPNCTFS